MRTKAHVTIHRARGVSAAALDQHQQRGLSYARQGTWPTQANLRAGAHRGVSVRLCIWWMCHLGIASLSGSLSMALSLSSTNPGLSLTLMKPGPAISGASHHSEMRSSPMIFS
jgi:hypothetical protein